jgi:hypothetical protein
MNPWEEDKAALEAEQVIRPSAGTTPGRELLAAFLRTESEMWWFGSIIFIIIWVAIAFWPARVAARKGHSFLLYFLFSLVFFPAALIVAYMVQDRSGGV